MIFVRNVPSVEELERFRHFIPEIEPETAHLTIRVVSNVCRMTERLDAYLGREGMSFGRMATLMQLARRAEEGLTPSELADRLGVTRATITGLLDGLEREGFIERAPHPSDRRSHVVHVTPAGLAKMQAIIPAHMKRISQVLAPLRDHDRKQLSRLVDLLGEGLATLPEP